MVEFENHRHRQTGREQHIGDDIGNINNQQGINI